MQNKLYSFIGLIKKSGKLSCGDDSVEIDIKKGKCKLLVIADDSSENTRKRFENMAVHHNISYVKFGEKEELGIYTGKYQTAVISIRDEGFARELLKRISSENYGGESIVKNQNT